MLKGVSCRLNGAGQESFSSFAGENASRKRHSFDTEHTGCPETMGLQGYHSARRSDPQVAPDTFSPYNSQLKL